MKRYAGIFFIIMFLIVACNKQRAKIVPEQELDAPTLLTNANEAYNMGQVEDAFRLYSFIYNNYPTSREYIDASLGLAKCYNQFGKYEEGMNLLYDLLRENMVPTRVPEIYNQMARYFEANAGISSLAGVSDEEADYQKALGYYQKAINYPNSDDAEAKGLAQYRIGELNLALHKLKEAATAYKLTKRNYPTSSWSAKADARLEEFRVAVNTVLGEMNPTSTPKIPSENMQNLPENQTAPADTTAKPEMNLK